MVRSVVYLMLLVFGLLLNNSSVFSQSNDQLKNPHPLGRWYGVSAYEFLLTQGELISNGIEWQQKTRFIPFFNPQWQYHYNGRTIGLFSGFGIRNIGFTHQYSNDTLSSIKLKQRAYTLNAPVGLKLGNLMKGNFLAVGVEGHLPFHFKEKVYEGGKVSREKEWFSENTTSFLYSFFLDFRFRYGSYFRINIYGEDLLSGKSRTIVLPGSGKSIDFRSERSSLVTFSFGTSLMTKKKRPLRLKDV